MGQILNKINPASDERKMREIDPIIRKHYDSCFRESPKKDIGEFYHGVCSIVEQINVELGNTQFKIPTQEAISAAYEKHKGKNKELSKEDFQKILREVIKDTSFTGIGAKEALIYIFGVPLISVFLKQRVMPRVPDELFIPGVTSATVLVLAGLNKI